MSDAQAQPTTPENAPKALHLVHRHFTPFALVLVAIGLFAHQPHGIYWVASLAALLVSAAFNFITARLANNAAGTPRFDRIRDVRVYGNLALNACLVYVLLLDWRPIWLLFLLSPVAFAVYESRANTLKLAVVAAGLLVWAFWVNELRRPHDLAEAATYALFIVVISHFVSRVTSTLTPASAPAASDGAA